MRLLLSILLLALGLGLFASAAQAEEVFILRNGAVVRGFVVRETEEKLVVRLAGFTEVNQVTVRKSEIARRYETKKSEPAVHIPPVGDDAMDAVTIPHVPGMSTGPEPTKGPKPRTGSSTTAPKADGPASVREPTLEDEGFFARLQRVTGMALPRSLEGLLLVGFLFFVVLTVMVAGGARVIGLKVPSLHASSSLGMLLGVFLAADIGLHHELLRADRAIWILPLQAAIWLFVARTALDAPVGRVVPLFAFALFGSACFIFFTGSVLVSL